MPVDLGDITGIQSAHGVTSDPGEAVPRRSGDVDVAAVDLEQPVEGGGILVAEHGVRAAGQHGGHPPAADGELRVTHGVDPRMEAMNPA